MTHTPAAPRRPRMFAGVVGRAACGSMDATYPFTFYSMQ